MGRLAHLQDSLPAFPKPCVVVDYSCPDKSGDWAEAQGATVVRVHHEEHFHKTRALNLGARRAIELGATRLAFLDADTLVQPSFEEFASKKASCLIAPPGHPPLVGVLVVPTEDFLRVGGYDENYQGWGCEDLDMRLRLYLEGSVFENIPAVFLSSIPHGNDLRTQHYAVKNHMISRATNAIRMEKAIRSLTGKSPAELDDTAKRLMRVV
jgi:hypothetical protein